MPHRGKTLLEWQFPEFEKHERGTAWYFWMTLIGGILLLSAIFTSNFLFTLIIILVAALLILYEHRGARTLTCRITDTGVIIGETFHPYDAIQDFRIVYEPPSVKHLYITFPSALKQRITIALVDENPVSVRSALRKYVLEDTENTGEPFSDMLARKLKL